VAPKGSTPPVRNPGPGKRVPSEIRRPNGVDCQNKNSVDFFKSIIWNAAVLKSFQNEITPELCGYLPTLGSSRVDTIVQQLFQSSTATNLVFKLTSHFFRELPAILGSQTFETYSSVTLRFIPDVPCKRCCFWNEACFQLKAWLRCCVIVKVAPVPKTFWQTTRVREVHGEGHAGPLDKGLEQGSWRMYIGKVLAVRARPTSYSCSESSRISRRAFIERSCSFCAAAEINNRKGRSFDQLELVRDLWHVGSVAEARISRKQFTADDRNWITLNGQFKRRL